METIHYPKKTKARKQHKCDFCGLPIKKGDTYLNSIHKDNDIYTFRTHEECEQLAKNLNLYKKCDNFVTQEDFFDEVSEFYIYLVRSEVSKLSQLVIEELYHVSMKRKLAIVNRYFIKNQK